MTTTFEPGSGTIRHARKRMFEGTPNEKTVVVGQQLVKAEARFLATEVTPFGPCDAQRERALAAGEPEPRPFWDIVAKTKQRVAALMRKKQSERKLGEDGTSPQPIIVQMPAAAAPAGKPAPGSHEELAAQLALFEDDQEMQDRIILRWQQKRNAAKGLPVVGVDTPATAEDLPAPAPEEPLVGATAGAPSDEPFVHHNDGV